MTASPTRSQLTLMTVHAHPDDETIGTGGVMARAVADGRRVVLVTCTRGELGEIVDPELDTPENHRRLGEIRAAELEAAMGALGVTEWENLGYRDSGMMGQPGNHDPAKLLAGGPRRGDRPAGLDGPPLPSRGDHRLQQLRRLRAPRPRQRAQGGRRRLLPGRRSRSGTRSRWPRSTAGPGRPKRTAACSPGRPRSSTSRRWDASDARRWRPGWRRPGCGRSGRVRIPRTRRRWQSGRRSCAARPSPTRRSRRASTAPGTRSSAGRPSWPTGRSSRCRAPCWPWAATRWQRLMGEESFILRAARVTTSFPETDLFDGLG